MSDSDISIFCWILGHEYDNIFNVKISSNDYIDNLRDAIKIKCQIPNPSYTLILYKVFIPRSVGPKLAEHVAELELSNLKLDPFDKLSKVFVDGIFDAHIRVIVRVPGVWLYAVLLSLHTLTCFAEEQMPRELLPEPAQKRPRIARDHGKYLHKSLGTMAPSTIAKTSEVYKVQHDPSDRLMNDRPKTDTDRVPIALLYHGFGRFLDVLKGASTHDTLTFDRRTFEEKVDEFVGFMNEYYRNEGIRNKKAIKSLNGIFECVLGDCSMLMQAIVFEARASDGHALSPTHCIEVILEVKNELSGTGADPIFELSSYYTHAIREEGSLQGLLGCFPFPALGIVVIG